MTWYRGFPGRGDGEILPPQPPSPALPPPPFRPGPSWVVVLTAPGVPPTLSHASLMSREEAEHEADQWRHREHISGHWTADVREVR